MILRPIMDLFKVPTYMRRLGISNGPLSVFIPLPVYGADIRGAHQRLSDGIYTVLYEAALETIRKSP